MKIKNDSFRIFVNLFDHLCTSSCAENSLKTFGSILPCESVVSLVIALSRCRGSMKTRDILPVERNAFAHLRSQKIMKKKLISPLLFIVVLLFTSCSGKSVASSHISSVEDSSLSGGSFISSGSLLSENDSSECSSSLGGKLSSLSSESNGNSSSSETSSENGNTPDPVGEYSVSSFTDLPENWELFAKSDTESTIVDYTDEEMNITHTNASVTEAKYYGSLYRIAIDREYTDFSFEISLKMSYPQSDTRWLGILYHTQLSGNYLTGYMANFRYNGNSASSAVTMNPIGFKDDTPTLAPEKLSDGKYHTIKIEMVGNQASHYIDTQLIKTWDVTSKDSYFGSTLLHGGFALIVNRSTVSIQSVKIDGELYDEKEEQVEQDTTLASTYRAESGLTNAPTVVLDVENETALNRVVAAGADGKRPSNIILHLDDAGYVTDSNGQAFISFESAYASLSHHIIPVVVIETEKAADAFIGYMQHQLNILDIAVMSKQTDLVKKVRTALPKIRGIVSFTDTIVENLYTDIIQPSNESGAGVALIDESTATYANVSYIQARFLSVWVKVDSTQSLDLHQCILSGAYGIVSNDYTDVLNTLETYPAGSYSRTIFNVAHRGLSGYNENSISSTLAAVQAGATHVELDGKLTKDNQIVMTHDSDVSRTTDGTGTIESKTLAEVKELSLDLYGEEKIPTLTEIIEAIRDSEIVLIFELKTNDQNLVDALKVVLDETDFYDRIVVISFHESSLARMRAILPQVATADLNPISSATFGNYLGSLCTWNTILDNEWDYAWDFERERGWVFNELFLRDRGIIGWYYTFENEEDMKKVIKGGFVGITSNIAETYSDEIRYLNPSENASAFLVGETVDLIGIRYSGESIAVEGKIYYSEDLGDRYAVIASSEVAENYTLYTQLFYIEK